MSQRRKWGGVVLAAVAAVALIALVVPDTRKYRGRTLIQWLQPTRVDFYGPDTEKFYQASSVLAFQEAGRAGIELLLRETALRDTSWNWRVFATYDELEKRGWRLGRRPRAFLWPYERRWRAAWILAQLQVSEGDFPLVEAGFLKHEQALNTLGTNAPSARVSNGAARRALCGDLRLLATAVARTGVQGMAAVTNAMARTTDPERLVTLAGALQAARYAASDNIVLETLNTAVLNTMIGLHDEASVPFVLAAATNGHIGAIAALGEYGPKMNHLLPHLFPLTTNSDPQVSFQAEIAVRKIRGEGQ